MNKKSIFTVLVVIIVAVSFIFMSVHSMKRSPKQEKDGIKIVKVDKVARAPESYKGYFGIEGDVLKIYASEKKFFLSCGDSCVRLPVKYEGELPRENTEIIAYGEIKTSDEGGYIFIADKVDIK